MHIKFFTILAFTFTLSGCVVLEPFAALHEGSVRKLSDRDLCLQYLAIGGRYTSASNIARSNEIQDRKLNCLSIVDQKDINMERRLISLERAAEDAEDAALNAASAARRAKNDAFWTNDRLQQIETNKRIDCIRNQFLC